MANPAADAIMLCDIDCLDINADLRNTDQKLTNQALSQRLPRGRRYKPSGILKELGVCHLNPRIFFPCHRMPAEESLADAAPEHLCRLRHDLGFSASYIGEQRVRWKRRAKTADQFDDCADWSSQKNYLAAARCCYRIGLG